MQDWLVEPGYEPVRDLFPQERGSLGIGGGAYCAYVAGRPVVDLWSGEAHPGTPWERSTTTILMSATKGFAAMCVQLLADRGLLDIDAPVAAYWPEFAQNGKEHVLVRHVLLHTAGLFGYDGQNDVTRLDGTGWDSYEAISAGLAAAPLEWEPGSRHGYHALSVGWLLAELVLRVSGRTLGSFFAEEIAGPLGLEAWIGTPASELGRVAHVHPTRHDHLPAFVRRTNDALEAAARDPHTLLGRAFLGDGTRSALDELELIFNSPAVLTAEFPAGGATATARALARCWAMVAGGGQLDGVRILSPESVAAWGTVVQNEPDVTLAGVDVPRLAAGLTKAKTPRTFGFLGNGSLPGLPARFGPHPDAFGAEGLGGQYGYCDPVSGIAVGFVRNDLAMIEVLQPQLTAAVYECARRLGHDVFTGPSVPRWKAALGRQLRRRIAVPGAPAELVQA
ncbi:MAG: beta-lactamase [Frankiales bacterium]|nr:beta-lactamase [Frankiales bacterium]